MAPLSLSANLDATAIEMPSSMDPKCAVSGAVVNFVVVRDSQPTETSSLVDGTRF